MPLRGLSRGWAEHRGAIPVPWHVPSWALCVRERGILTLTPDELQQGEALRVLRPRPELPEHVLLLAVSVLPSRHLGTQQRLSLGWHTSPHSSPCPGILSPTPCHTAAHGAAGLGHPCLCPAAHWASHGLTAPRHRSLLQRSFPTFPDSSGSHCISAELCHSPGTAHTNPGGANLCRESWIPLLGWFPVPEHLLPLCEGTGTGTQGGTQLHPPPAQIWALLWEEDEQFPVSLCSLT